MALFNYMDSAKGWWSRQDSNLCPPHNAIVGKYVKLGLPAYPIHATNRYRLCFRIA